MEDSEGSGRVVMHKRHLSVQGRGFEEATKLFGSGEKAREHESECEQQFLPWPGLHVSLEPDETSRRERRETREGRRRRHV